MTISHSCLPVHFPDVSTSVLKPVCLFLMMIKICVLSIIFIMVKSELHNHVSTCISLVTNYVKYWELLCTSLITPTGLFYAKGKLAWELGSEG